MMSGLESFDREIMRLLPCDKPVTKKMRQAIDALIAQRKVADTDVSRIVLATTEGRVDRLDALSEMEAMVVWQALRGKVRAAD
jgi:hypothetical protein